MKFTIETPNEKVMKEVIKLSNNKNSLKVILSPLLYALDKEGFNANSARYDLNLHDDKHMHIIVKLSK